MDPLTLTHNEEEKTLGEWSELTGISYSVLYARIRLGWDTHRILTEPQRKPKTIKYGKKELTVIELSQKTGIHPSTLYTRIRQGITGKELMAESANTAPPISRSMDKLQHLVLDSIVAYKSANDGVSPSFQEIHAYVKEDFPKLSIGTVKVALNMLVAQGKVKYEYNHPRSIQVTGGEWRYIDPMQEKINSWAK